MNRRGLTRAFLSSAGAALALSPRAQAQSATLQRASLTPAEDKAGIKTINRDYPPGHVRRYGAIGDGIANDTQALNRAIAVVNQGHTTLQADSGDVYSCEPLLPITADDVFIDARGATLKVQPGSWKTRTDGSTHLLITGARARVNHLVLDGNQHAFASAPGTGRLLHFGSGTVLTDVTVKNSPAQGARSGAADVLCIGCHFDDNANLGMELDAASNMVFVACTWNRNGYGFRQPLDTNQFAAFGLAVRFRSHHLTFESCEATQNGRDGMAIGQGSYACKMLCCTAGMNGDGGFTIHSDLTAAKIPGNGEYCYDLEYIDCESYGNYGSGLVAFTPAHNITVLGGRYYNNHQLAGSLPFQSSYPNGLYFAAGSHGITVRTKAYDDRQQAVVGSIAGQGSTRNLGVQGWAAGTRNVYPKLVFHDADGAFQGYGAIESESAGAVTVSSAPHNGVDFLELAAGWRVSQRVQHNGCLLDNGCQGQIEVDGFGLLAGPMGFTGWKVMSGYLGNGQNVRLPGSSFDGSGELVLNPSFDSNIDAWKVNAPSGGNSQHHRGEFRRSAGALQLKAGAHDAAEAIGSVVQDCLAMVSAAFVECSVWCYARTQAAGGLELIWQPGHASFSSTLAHPGGGWKYLTIGAFIPATVTRLAVRLYAAAGSICYFDTVSLRVKGEPSDGRDGG
jgi:hypothetical protein